MLKKLTLAGTITILVASMGVALAAGPITRNGIDYSGIRGGQGCEIKTDHVTDLSVNCGKGEATYVRYRFLKVDGGVRDNATVSLDASTWFGTPCSVRWMVHPGPKNPARTLRVLVPAGTYCDIHSVTWSQP